MIREETEKIGLGNRENTLMSIDNQKKEEINYGTM